VKRSYGSGADASEIGRRSRKSWKVSAKKRQIRKLPLHPLRLPLSGLSILFTATIIGTFAALAWSIAFARLRHDAVIRGHHQHQMSVTFRAARAHARERFVARRIHEHHALPCTCTLYAPMCWVIPPPRLRRRPLPDGVQANWFSLWSTWPITVTTGGRGLRFSLVSSFATSNTISSSKDPH